MSSSNKKTILERAFDDMHQLRKLAETSPELVARTHDRFKTTWISFNDPAAVAFQNIVDQGPEKVRAKLRELQLLEGTLSFINQVSDEYERLKHTDDQDTNTGVGIAEGDWDRATRGEKLRYLARPLHPFGDHQQRVRFVIQELTGATEAEAENEPEQDEEFSNAVAKCNNLSQKEGMTITGMLALLENDVTVLDAMKGFSRELEKLVREECKAGWDWAASLNKQKHLRKTIDETWGKCSKDFWIVVLDELETRGGSEDVKKLVEQKMRGN
ncbi:uncharacterized protein RAG0_13974 [Rhynchosporium agropyri]|uniref:Uncharacterized protein n=1 Tax=Rhynchosporium agropyri TaxID=914238 RepID=A0A1E1LF02_9HELO|nr:uncharacterized protein RAG0_13974 [Rhynchosporium agropyri]